MTKPTILCMYSGGLDSVGALYRLFTDPEYAKLRIHVHHMELHNVENRARAEQVAVERTLAEFARLGHRPALFTRSAHDYTCMQSGFLWDMDLCSFMGANMAMIDPAIRAVARGRTRTDVETNHEDLPGRARRAEAIFKAAQMYGPRRVEMIYPVIDLTKREIWDMLPDTLRRWAWSCRSPVYDAVGRPRVCGRCRACQEIREMMAQRPE